MITFAEAIAKHKKPVIRPVRKSFLFLKLVNMCRFASNFPSAFLTHDDLLHMYFAFRFGQLNRKAFYDFLCTTCFLTGITARYWRYRFNVHLDHNFLFFPSSHYSHWYYFEYMMLNISPQQLSYDDFYYGQKDPYKAHKYHHFFLKAGFFAFVIVWKSMAHLRRVFYSHYMRSHFSVIDPSYRHTRFALTRQWALYFDRERRILSFKQLAARFVLDAYNLKYHVYLASFSKPYFNLPALEFQPQSFSLGSNNSLRFMMGLAKIPTKFFKLSRIFRIGVHQWVGLLANSIMARYTNLFTQYTRLDYEHGPILYRVLSFTTFSHNRLMSLWLAEWKDSLFEKFFAEGNFFRLFTTFDFLLMRKKWSYEYDLKKLFPWVSPPSFFFTYKTANLYINDNFDPGFFRNFTRARCFDVHNPIMGDSWHVYGQFWSQYLVNYRYFGDFHFVDKVLLKKPLHWLYHQWRIFNISPVYDFLQGRLPLRFFYRKIELDFQISYRYRWLWSIFKKKFPARTFHTFCKPKFKLRRRFNSGRFFVTPIPERHAIRAYLVNWYIFHGHEKRKPKTSLKLTPYVGFSMIASLFAATVARSKPLSFFMFFFLWDFYSKDYNVEWSLWHSGSLASLYINQSAVRSWIHNYRSKWPHYRRKISKSGIHSLTNPFFRRNWMRVFHKCRRTGFKKHELPYYCYDESAELISDLASLIRNQIHTIFDIPGIRLIEETFPYPGVFSNDLKKFI